MNYFLHTKPCLALNTTSEIIPTSGWIWPHYASKRELTKTRVGDDWADFTRPTKGRGHLMSCIFYYISNWLNGQKLHYLGGNKGQLNSEWIYEVIVSPKMQTKNYKDFCPTKQTRIVAKKTAYTHQKITKKVLRSLFVW